MNEECRIFTTLTSIQMWEEVGGTALEVKVRMSPLPSKLRPELRSLQSLGQCDNTSVRVGDQKQSSSIATHFAELAASVLAMMRPPLR